MWYKYKLKRFSRGENYQVERNDQEKELGLIKYNLKEYEKLRDEGPDTDVVCPPQFSTIGEFVDALLESGQVLKEEPLAYTGKPLSILDIEDPESKTIMEQLNTQERLGDFEYPPKHKDFKGKSFDLHAKFDRLQQQSIQKLNDAMSHDEFLEKLKRDDPGKIITYIANIYHYHPSNFEWCCRSITGYSLHDSLLVLKWYNDPMHQKFKDAYEGCIIKAKKCGMDLSKTYVADCKVFEGAKVQNLYKESFIKGRGRGGATDKPITIHLRVTLQERKEPFSSVWNDGLEDVRIRLRARVFPTTKTPEEICEQHFSRYPSKHIHSVSSESLIRNENGKSEVHDPRRNLRPTM